MDSVELGDLILEKLAELSKRSFGEPQSILEIAKNFGETDRRSVYSLFKMLESRGLVQDANISGDIMGFITAEGIKLVERGRKTGKRDKR